MLLPEILDQIAHLPDLVGIEAAGGLVENEQIGFVDERVREPDALPVTFRKRADDFFLNLFQPAQLLHIADAFRDPAVRNAFQRRAVIEILSDAHVVIERHVFRHVTEVRAGLERLLENIETGDRGAPGSRRHKTREDPHRRAFPGAVRSEKPHDLAFAHLETQVLDRRLPCVAFREIFNFDHEAVILSDN